MNMMKTFVPVLKMEYGGSDDTRERPCSPSFVEDANPPADVTSVGFSKTCSTLVDGPLSSSR